MLEPQRMDRVLIVGTKDVMEATINALHDLDLLHIEDYTEEGAYFRIGKPLKSATSLSEKLLKLRSIRSHLKTKDNPYPKEGRQKVLEEINRDLASLEKTLNDKMTEKGALDSEVKELARKKEALEPFVALGMPLDMLYGYESVSVFVGTISGDVEPLVSSITKDYELFSAPYGNGKVFALYVPKAVSAAVSETLAKNGFIEVEPLRDTGDPAALAKNATDRAAEVEKKREAAGAEIKALNVKYARFILSSEELLTIDTQKAEAPLRFATSENVFAVDGWVPSGEYEKLKAALAGATGDRIFVAKVEPEHKAYEGEVEPHVKEHHEVDAPVEYANPKWMYPLQAFIDLYSRPKYDEIDPTTIFFFTFPLFYGFILGDMGYGLILFIAGLLIRQKLKHSEGWKILMNALMICAISSMAFGVLFGEFMGVNMAADGLFGFKLPYPHEMHIGPVGPFSLPLERLVPGGFHEGSYVFGIKDLLVLTCLIGVVQIILGYVLGFVNEYRHHGLKTAVLHKVSWILVLLGGVAAIWYVFPLMLTHNMGAINPADPLFVVGIVLFLAGLIMVILGEGPMGIIEVPALMSNVLSYTRLLAVGLSSVGIALVTNTIAGMMAGAGTVGIIAAIPVLVIFHGINVLLGIIAPGLHALRLHYVEFFRKFYEGGGKIYDPFGYIRKYTED